MPLSSSEIKALKNADDVVFHYEHREGSEPRTFVICKKRVTPNDGFGERELTVEFDICPARFTKYELPGDDKAPIVWATGIGRKYTPEWATARDLLRQGDDLVPLWVLGNNSDNLRKHGFSHDEFKVAILRPSASGVRQMTFWLEDLITDSPLIRMATRSTRVFT